MNILITGYLMRITGQKHYLIQFRSRIRYFIQAQGRDLLQADNPKNIWQGRFETVLHEIL
jgi:hypothetical protein